MNQEWVGWSVRVETTNEEIFNGDKLTAYEVWKEEGKQRRENGSCNGVFIYRFGKEVAWDPCRPIEVQGQVKSL